MEDKVINMAASGMCNKRAVASMVRTNEYAEHLANLQEGKIFSIGGVETCYKKEHGQMVYLGKRPLCLATEENIQLDTLISGLTNLGVSPRGVTPLLMMNAYGDPWVIGASVSYVEENWEDSDIPNDLHMFEGYPIHLLCPGTVRKADVAPYLSVRVKGWEHESYHDPGTPSRNLEDMGQLVLKQNCRELQIIMRQHEKAVEALNAICQGTEPGGRMEAWCDLAQYMNFLMGTAADDMYQPSSFPKYFSKKKMATGEVCWGLYAKPQPETIPDAELINYIENRRPYEPKIVEKPETRPKKKREEEVAVPAIETEAVISSSETRKRRNENVASPLPLEPPAKRAVVASQERAGIPFAPTYLRGLDIPKLREYLIPEKRGDTGLCITTEHRVANAMRKLAEFLQQQTATPLRLPAELVEAPRARNFREPEYPHGRRYHEGDH